MRSLYLILQFCIFIIFFCSSACTKIEKKGYSGGSVNLSKLAPVDYKNPFGVLINKSNGIKLAPNDRVQLAHELGVQYIRLSIESGNWNDPVKQREFLDNYKLYSALNPPIEVLLNVSWQSEIGGPVPFPGVTVAYKAYVKGLIDTLTSGRYAAPALVVVENEENNPNFHAIRNSNDLNKYVAQLRYVIQLCKQKNIKVANGGFTTLGMNLLVWDYYKNVLNDSIKADEHLKKMLPPEVTLDMNSYKIQTKISIVKTLIGSYASLDLSYFNFHWYEPVQALFWTDSVPPTSIDTNHISPGVLENILNYLRYNAPTAGKQIITNEAGQVTFSSAIPEEITCALQSFPVVSWYSGDGNYDKELVKYQAKALHNAQRGIPTYSLRPNGIAYKNNIAAIVAAPYSYCPALER